MDRQAGSKQHQGALTQVQALEAELGIPSLEIPEERFNFTARTYSQTVPGSSVPQQQGGEEGIPGKARAPEAWGGTRDGEEHTWLRSAHHKGGGCTATAIFLVSPTLSMVWKLLWETANGTCHGIQAPGVCLQVPRQDLDTEPVSRCSSWYPRSSCTDEDRGLT